MKNLLSLFLICLVVALSAQPQVVPPQGAKLNYNQVMLDHERIKGADTYIFQIAENKNGNNFNQILHEENDSSTALMITGLQFGKKYEWRYAGMVKNQPGEWKGPYYFEITADPYLLNNLSGFNVAVNNVGANAGGLILNDYTNSIYDRKGNLVWYLPGSKLNNPSIKDAVRANEQLFDLRLTPAGTITYLTDKDAIECNLSGHVLWKAPDDGKVSGGPNEYYNHQFKRLSNGHYMVLSNQMLLKPGHYEPAFVEQKDLKRIMIAGQEYTVMKFGTIIEYDKHGNIIWQWKSTKYFGKDSVTDLMNILPTDFYLNAHINSFSVGPDNKYVYAGFRNVSRIIKIEKSTGKVVQSWGQNQSGEPGITPVNFYRQHDCNILRNGDIALLNSNDYHRKDSFPTVIVFSTKPEDNGKVVWKYVCKFDSVDGSAQQNAGNVDRLDNGNLLVCTGSTNRMFEITPQKKITWEASVKLNNPDARHRLYRAHYTSSLYPCYFTSRSTADTVTASFPSFAQLVFNTGTESDSYLIKVKSLSGAFVHEFTTPLIAAKASYRVEIKPDVPLEHGDNIEVVVISKTNPDFKRKSKVVITLRFPE